MVRFDIITLTSPMMTRSELQQLCDEISRLRSACERLADEIDVVTARELRNFALENVLLNVSFSSTFASGYISIESAPSTASDTRSIAMPLAPAVAISHDATAACRVASHELSAHSTTKLQWCYAWKRTYRHHQQFAQSGRRRQRRRMVLLNVHIPELSFAEPLRAVRYASKSRYNNHIEQLSSYATK